MRYALPALMVLNTTQKKEVEKNSNKSKMVNGLNLKPNTIQKIQAFTNSFEFIHFEAEKNNKNK